MGDPYENLANAVVAMAARDYMKALKTLRRSPDNMNAKDIAGQCERFFRSTRYRKLTTVDGEYLMNRLNREALK